jgi:hypothetical protein
MPGQRQHEQRWEKRFLRDCEQATWLDLNHSPVHFFAGIAPATFYNLGGDHQPQLKSFCLRTMGRDEGAKQTEQNKKICSSSINHFIAILREPIYLGGFSPGISF